MFTNRRSGHLSRRVRPLLEFALMDTRAELTLRLVRIAQEALQPRSSLVDWMLYPHYRRASWTDARQLLATAAKPVLVAPLVEPGCLAFWGASDLSADARRSVDAEIANQRDYFTSRIAALALTAPSFVESPDAIFRLPLADFEDWSAEYCIPVGFGVTRSAADTARVLVRLPGGHAPPVGWIPPESPHR